MRSKCNVIHRGIERSVQMNPCAVMPSCLSQMVLLLALPHSLLTISSCDAHLLPMSLRSTTRFTFLESHRTMHCSLRPWTLIPRTYVPEFPSDKAKVTRVRS